MTVDALDQGRGSDPNSWSSLQVLARGANRVCVVDPDNLGFCLKFELPNHERSAAGIRERTRRWLGRRFARWSTNALELRAWRLARERYGQDIEGRFARCVELVGTPFGQALRCERIFRADGSPAPTLHALLSCPSPYGADALCAAVHEFERWLLSHAIPLHDLNPANFVVLEDTRALRLVCIDAKSTLLRKELLPLSHWIPPMMRRKTARRAERLRQRIRCALEPTPALAITPAAH